MTLTDLMNNHYTRGVREAMLDLILGRSDNIVKVGDVMEMLLSVSFAVKDAVLDWEWLGIDEKECPPQRLVGRCLALNISHMPATWNHHSKDGFNNHGTSSTQH